MDIEQKRLNDLAESIKASADTDTESMAGSLVESLGNKGWLILYGREVPEVDLQAQINDRLGRLESMARNLEDGLQRLIRSNA